MEKDDKLECLISYKESNLVSSKFIKDGKDVSWGDLTKDEQNIMLNSIETIYKLFYKFRQI